MAMKRLAVVTAAATAGFAAALIHFGTADTAESCVVDVPTDRSYTASFEGSVTMDQTNHTLLVTKGGQPVSDARICLNTYMVGMSGMAMTASASQQAAGRYNVPFQFSMGGPWQATVIVDGKSGQVGVPIQFDVGAGAMPAAPNATPGG
ncbi:MAG TPA: FixH family protein [Candidatus Dormibacteraeota bacterium]|nr:FixH family protein [Candidatus Dormibacteraeota bacterium]